MDFIDKLNRSDLRDYLEDECDWVFAFPVSDRNRLFDLIWDHALENKFDNHKIRVMYLKFVVLIDPNY